MHTIMCPRPQTHECDLQWWQSLTSARCQEVGLLFVYVALHSPHFVVANTQTMRLVVFYYAYSYSIVNHFFEIVLTFPSYSISDSDTT